MTSGVAIAAIAAIALLDSAVAPNILLGYLYVFPILVLGLHTPRWFIVCVATACGVLREAFSPFAWHGGAAARIGLSLAAFLGAGLFVSELARNRLLAVEHAARLREQIQLRQELEEELRVVVESSPAAILTLDANGTVLLANEAAHRLLAFVDRPLRGERIVPYLPALGSVFERPHTVMRTSMECIGRRCDGEAFLAQVWFSRYTSLSGPRLAAIVLDASEQLRDREVLGLASVAAASRILFGAVSHEVRNLSAAAAVAHANLARTSDVGQNEDFKALGALVEGLRRIASSELRLSADRAVESIGLQSVLDELRIVLEPSIREEGIALEWRISKDLPRVLADHHSLLQIFLNLTQNSQRAMIDAPERCLTVSAVCEGDSVVVRFRDTGPGVPSPEELFRPFLGNGEATGLGLFVSRTIARSFAGDLRYEPQPTGSCFAVRLMRAA